MRVQCNGGFFIIRDEATFEIPRFVEIFGLPISSYRDFYTFDPLVDADEYSLVGKPYLGVNATKTIEGDPWDVMRENNIVYDFNTGLAKLISTVKETLFLKSASYYYISNGLIVPGSLRDDGKRVTDYSARFSFDTMSFRYSEVVCG